MATETDAARDRVLAARATLGDELEALEASARAAVDVPARIRRSPGKAAAVVGGTAFVALGGPRRVFRAAKRTVTGGPAPFQRSMLPDEIERTLRKLGDDGDKVRGTLERDFAAYAKQASKDRSNLRTILLLSVARPLLTRGAKAFADGLFSPDDASFRARLAQVRERARQRSADEPERIRPDARTDGGATGDDDPGSSAGA